MFDGSAYRLIKAVWYVSDEQRQVVCVPATEFKASTGDVSVPYVTLLNLHSRPIQRHEVTVKCIGRAKVRFVVYVGEHNVRNQSIRALDHNSKFAGEVIVFRAGKAKSVYSLVNIRPTKFEYSLIDAAAKEYVLLLFVSMDADLLPTIY